MSRGFRQRMLINSRQALNVRCSLTRDLAAHIARGYIYKFLSDVRRIDSLSYHINEFAAGGRPSGNSSD